MCSVLPHLALFLLVCPSVTLPRVPLYFAFLPPFVFILHVFIFRFNRTLSTFCSFVPRFHCRLHLFSSHSVILTASFHNWPQALPHFAFISSSVGIAKPLFHKYAIKGTLWSFATIEETSFLQMARCCVCILKRKCYVYLCYSHPATGLTQFQWLTDCGRKKKSATVEIHRQRKWRRRLLASKQGFQQ